MMSRNLSVELRPQTLDEFIGCESITGPIKEGLSQGRVDSTYLFFGPPGCGKTSMARAVFRLINGEQEEYDLIEPDTSELNAENLRDLIVKARFHPWTGKYKGIILDEAHKIRSDVQTILLKALEEPCPSTVWFVCSSEPGSLSEAIRRRGANNKMPELRPAEMGVLVTRSIERTLGIAGLKKYDPLPLASALEKHEVMRPGFIVRAVESYITGVPANEAAQVTEVTNVDTFAIAKGAAAGNWAAVQKLLATAPSSAARDVRGKVSSYFRAILVKEPAGTPRAERCVWAIQQMAELSNQNQFEDGLIWAATCAALYNISIGQKEYRSKKG